MMLKIRKKGWKGKLHCARRQNGKGFAVTWDAKSPDGWFIYDTKGMTAKQIHSWTGVTPPPKGAPKGQTVKTPKRTPKRCKAYEHVWRLVGTRTDSPMRCAKCKAWG